MIRVDQAFENIRYTENELKKRGYKPLYIGLYGSDNYHLNTAESDYDFKAIVAPTIRDFIKGKQVSTTIELPFGLCDVKNPQNMFNCWKKQNINFLEILFTNYYLFNDNLFYDLREMRKEIETKKELIATKRARAFVESLDDSIRKAVVKGNDRVVWTENLLPSDDLQECRMMWEKAKVLFQENGFEFSWKEQSGLTRFYVIWEY